ncbi:MAG: CarD family transcriptional regulator [Fusicatenibacter sp.]|nr:CarD family transcriptional regulator [Lachnospiraceae bacterium]MDY2937800.1 CarD family transcriptional regulator [Fusicatenibacter sp.]
MFEVGEYIVYGATGICKVEDITTMDMAGVPRDRLYYVLSPCRQKESRIFTPVDNQKTVMRQVISREEALQLIDSMPQIEELWIPNEKMREELYKEALRSCNCREWVRIIKTLYTRKKKREGAGKKMPSTDERYFRSAEENLYSELAIPLEISPSEVGKYIKKRLDEVSVERIS